MTILKKCKVFFAGPMVILFYACGNQGDTNVSGVNINEVPIINYSVVATFEHDTSLFTEGFLFYSGKLFESSGSPSDIPFTKSVIGYYDSGFKKFNIKAELAKQYFGEGIVILNDKIYQLTYKSQKGFVYDAATFKKEKEFSYANVEGWGLTTDGKNIIMSDGSDMLTFLNSETLLPEKVLKVTESGIACDRLNELEYINGFIYTNVWQTPYILKIDPVSGNVIGKLDLSSLVNEAKARKFNSQELNGIAYNQITGNVYVTGKLWPFIYQIDFGK